MRSSGASIYLGLIDAMGTKYSFKSLKYWQPCLLDKVKLTTYENSELDTRFISGAAEFDRKVSRSIAALGSQNGIRDLSGLFRDQIAPYFIDEAHVTGAANRIIAEVMMDDITAALARIKPASSPRIEGAPN